MMDVRELEIYILRLFQQAGPDAEVTRAMEAAHRCFLAGDEAGMYQASDRAAALLNALRATDPLAVALHEELTRRAGR